MFLLPSIYAVCIVNLHFSHQGIHFPVSYTWAGFVAWDLLWPIEHGWSGSGPVLSQSIRRPCLLPLALLDPCKLPGEQVHCSLLEGERPRGEGKLCLLKLSWTRQASGLSWPVSHLIRISKSNQDQKNHLFLSANLQNHTLNSFFFFINLFIFTFGCVGSSLLHAGFL